MPTPTFHPLHTLRDDDDYYRYANARKRRAAWRYLTKSPIMVKTMLLDLPPSLCRQSTEILVNACRLMHNYIRLTKLEQALRANWTAYTVYLKEKYPPPEGEEFELTCPFHQNIDRILNGEGTPPGYDPGKYSHHRPASR